LSGLFRYVEDTASAKTSSLNIQLVATGALLFYAGGMGGLDGSLTGLGNIAPVEMRACLRRSRPETWPGRERFTRDIPVARLVYSEPFVYLQRDIRRAAALADTSGDHGKTPQLL